MAENTALDRRTFLYGAAATAALTMLAACSSDSGSGGQAPSQQAPTTEAETKGSETDPLPRPSSFQEAPSLAAQVEAGELPPVEERLPENPYVVPHRWWKPGKYGGNLVVPSSSSNDPAIKEYMYGHSLLRFLNDSRDIGPGLVESWESNEDATEWTLHFRKGLKWSDGHPWSTEDILFWWEDMVLNEEHTELPPDEARSGKGTLMTMKAIDEVTLSLSFDAPAPLTADRLAMWVKRGNGPSWMEPKHYLKQFHPKYNPNVSKDWATADGEFEAKRDFSQNPECPTMTGWRLKSYQEGRQAVWERNPYYWCVDREGRQLPYIDTLTIRVVDDPEVVRLQIQEGKLDYVHGPFVGLGLGDISGFKRTEERSGMRVLLWDGGSGTGSMFFFNYDYKDARMRELFREPKFRQALSLAVNRADIQKQVYFTTGEPTTGTLSPKSIEYHVNDEGKEMYRRWRDAYVGPDPERAKALLDEIGVREGPDGKRRHPDGGDLTIRLDYPATAGAGDRTKNEHLKRDWEAIGLKVTLNPVPPESHNSQWAAGLIATQTAWEVSNAHNHLAQPAWLVPIEPQRWAPLHGQFYSLRGTPQEKEQLDLDPYERTPPRVEPDPDGPIAALWKLYDQSKVEPDEMKRHQLVWEMIKIHIEHGPFFMGTVGNTPQLVLAHRDLRNVPTREQLASGGLVNPWQHPTPAVYDPEIYFWENPEEHS